MFKEAVKEIRKKKADLLEQVKQLDKFLYAAMDICEHEWVWGDEHPHSGRQRGECSICGATTVN